MLFTFGKFVVKLKAMKKIIFIIMLMPSFLTAQSIYATVHTQHVEDSNKNSFGVGAGLNIELANDDKLAVKLKIGGEMFDRIDEGIVEKAVAVGHSLEVDFNLGNDINPTILGIGYYWMTDLPNKEEIHIDRIGMILSAGRRLNGFNLKVFSKLGVINDDLKFGLMVEF